jgi:hypothetical protein
LRIKALFLSSSNGKQPIIIDNRENISSSHVCVILRMNTLISVFALTLATKEVLLSIGFVVLAEKEHSHWRKRHGAMRVDK